MYTVRRTAAFDEWFNGIADVTIKIRLARRLERATRGLLGDVESVSGDVSEMREHVGAG